MGPGGVGLGLGDGVGDGVGVGEGDGAGVMLVVILVEHVTTLPPGFPVPLHWLMLIGSAGLIVEGSTVQRMVPPPPFADPLHWVTVAPVVVAGNGSQSTVPPPPPPEPTHWLTVADVTGAAPGVSALMLFVIRTVQVVGCAASLPDALHCRTSVTMSDEVVVVDPLPGGHGSLAHNRLTVTVELVTPPLIVLTTVTEQTMLVVAPPGPGPMPLHWSMAMLAALAGGGEMAIPAMENAAVSSSIAMAMCHPRMAEPRTEAVSAFMYHGLSEECARFHTAGNESHMDGKAVITGSDIARYYPGGPSGAN